MKSIYCLLVAALMLPFVGQAKPVITVTSPKARANLTNGVLTATGTTRGTPPVAAVYYSFNGGDWALASGTTNWSVPDLALTAGANTLWAYAVDTNNAASLTSKVSFTYVVKLPITVLTNGNGKVAPAYNGKPLQIGNKYTMNAVPAPGFKFSSWTFNGTYLTNRSSLSFVMKSNLTYTANFVDSAAPLCVVTYPAVKHSVSNSPLSAICRASDNTGVTAVYYQLNGGGWLSDAASTDGTNWTIANLALTAGANSLQVYATDAVGNKSRTNTVAFTYVTNASPSVVGRAPASLAGMVGTVVGASGDSGIQPPFEISFGASTWAQSNSDTNQNVRAGYYTYTVLSSNTVQVGINTVTPPTEAGQSTKAHIFTFTNSTTCVFTNEDSSLGTVTFASAANLVPSSSSILTINYWDTNSGSSGTLIFGQGMFTNYSNYGTAVQTVNTWGTYSFTPFSPVAAMLQLNGIDPVAGGQTDFTLLRFSTATAGTWHTANLGIPVMEDHSGVGGFSIVQSANPPAGNAPMSIAGKLVTVSENGRQFKVSFGDCTYAAFDSSLTNENCDIDVYSYIKTGPNTALLLSTTILPPNNMSFGDQSGVLLTFTSSSAGTAEADKGPASFTIATAPAYAPASVAGKTVTPSAGGTGTFNPDGTFTFSKPGQTPETGAYAYTRFSPVGAMLVITHPDGGANYLQLQFSSTAAGSWYETDFDSTGNLNGVDIGTFTLR